MRYTLILARIQANAAETRQQKADRRSALLASATALLGNTTITAEQRSTIENSFAEARQIGTDIALMDEASRFAAEERSRVEAEERALRAGRPPLPQPGQGQGDQTADQRAADQAQREERGRQYTAAYRNYMVTGRDEELRAMGAATGPGGGYAIPTELVPDVERATLAYGGVAGFVRLLPTTTGEQMNWPLSNDTANAATVIGENTDQDENDLVLATTALTVAILQTGMVKIPRTLVRDAAFDFGAFIKDNLGERAGRGLSKYVMGTSTNANFDPLAASAHLGATSADPAIITLSDVANLFGALDPSYANQGKFVMNRRTQIYLSTQRNGLGAPIFQLDANGLVTKLFGQDIVIDVNTPDIAAGNRAVIFGNLQKYLLRTVEAMEVQRLDERFATANQIAFLGFFRAGSRLLDAGSHPIQVLQQHA